MITPRRTRLVRASDLHDLRRVLAALCLSDECGGPSSRVVLVPTRGAGIVLGQELEDGSKAGTRGLPLLLTRDEFYDVLHERLPDPPRRLTSFERDAVAQAAAHASTNDLGELPFRIRPGLVAEILRFYDQMRRQSQQVTRFEELIAEALGNDEGDRGTERLLRQTRFLARAFHEYEQRVEASGACDEHGLRAELLTRPLSRPVRHVLVTVPDWIADPAGLFLADFDLLTRLEGLEHLDILSSVGVLASGFHERIHNWWPGLEEVGATDIVPCASPVKPTLVRPDLESGQWWFTHRDREEELIAVAERLANDPEGMTPSRAAIVFRKPLPYLYLAPRTLTAAGIPYQIVDRMPLAAEPVVSAVALLLDAVTTRFTRAALVELLSSPHLQFLDGERPISRESINQMNRALSDARFLGDLERLEVVMASRPDDDVAGPAFMAALSTARDLSAMLEPAPASHLLRLFTQSLERRLRPPREGDPFAEREGRGRAAVVGILKKMEEAHAAHHDPLWTPEDLSASIRRAIGDETFTLEADDCGVHLIDDQAARYGQFDDITIVGLVESDWPERTRRNVLYPPRLLKALGWPSESDRQAAADARFIDLLTSSNGRVELSTFTLDDQAVVTRSIQLDEVPRARLSSITRKPTSWADRLSEPLHAHTSNGESRDASSWRALRSARSPASSPKFHGAVGLHQNTRPWSVSALETYQACPFKFFAQHVLKLQEEPDDEEVMDPRRQGQLVHAVFETFFSEWQAAGHREIAASSLSDARAQFARVVERALEQLSPGEAGLERTRLLGSPAAAGLGEAVFRMEAERDVPVVERLLEFPLNGRFTIETSTGSRDVELRGKADRLDLLADGTFRLIDYKLGWPPDKSRALQLPIYGLCAEQKLVNRHGRRWILGEALYLAFKGPKRVVPLFTPQQDRDEVMRKAQERLLDSLDAIDRGDFPPAPDDVFRCETCTFSSVCRKDYVGNV